MSRAAARFAAFFIACLAIAASAQDVKVHAFADARLVDPTDTTSFIDGGPGHLRYGGTGTDAHIGAAAIVVTAQLAPAWFVLADVQLQRTDRNDFQLPEAFVRYRPVSTTAWRGSLKAGVYFLPISLENDGLGWTSPWTITPSALNSWVGEELRGIGAEGREEWRTAAGTLSFGAGLVRHNDVAGNILVLRGWSLSDVTYGLGGRLREPSDEREQYAPFQSIGGRTGWYGDAGWKSTAGFEVRVLRYDNRADPSAFVHYAGDERLFAWRTRFWSAGALWDAGPVTFIAQAMDGDTAVRPGATEVVTHFQSGFVLAGWNHGAWRPTLRIERFRTWPSYELGHALTAALNWRPYDWLRLSAEWMHVNIDRQPLVFFGDPSRQRGNQLQLLARVMY